MKKPRLLPDRDANRRQRPELNLPPVSLMWPDRTPTMQPASAVWEHDLGLAECVQVIAPEKRYQAFVRQTLLALVTDPAVITWRQDVLDDFVRNPALVDTVSHLLPRLANLRQGSSLLGQRQRNALLETADRLAELDLYADIVQELERALQAADVQSPALVTLRASLSALIQADHFQELCRDLPALRTPLENIASLTIGINLDAQLQPRAAVLLAVNDFSFGEPASLLERLIGFQANGGEDSGLAPLHHTPSDPDQRLLSPLFQDLDRLLAQVVQPVSHALNRYVRTGSGTLTSLEYELAFFVVGSRLVQTLRKRGIECCRPEIAPAAERVTEIHNLVNITLALRSADKPVPSDVNFGAEGRIAILTGPNSGGKTTYLRGVGLAQVLFQAGLSIPASGARMSPVDCVFTHFPALETRQQGRLAEEASRLRDLFGLVSARSLVLLNETFSSTASGEALYLAQDILCALRSLGARAVFATHLSDLAGQISVMEATVDGESRFCSLVAGVRLTEQGEVVATFQIERGLPLGRSYAQEIARRHGISLGQILAMRTTSGSPSVTGT